MPKQFQISNFKFQITKSKHFISCKKLLEIGNWKLEIPAVKQAGFTLIEIIIAITIISLISALIVPNLRNFNQNQQLEEVATDLVQALNQTQSNAMSRIACPNNFPTTEWRIKISPTGYQQTAVCTDITGATSPAPQVFPVQNFNPPAISMTSSTCSEQLFGDTIEIIYSGNSIAFNCINGATTLPLTTDLEIKLTDSNNTQIHWLIQINKSGLITKDIQI
jgi:prepilin-type N-terminal cleavage/methylation domain-containing protein